jgi:hypothetical protein
MKWTASIEFLLFLSRDSAGETSFAGCVGNMSYVEAKVREHVPSVVVAAWSDKNCEPSISQIVDELASPLEEDRAVATFDGAPVMRTT